MISAFTGDKTPVPSLDVTKIKLDIINAAFRYGQAKERMGELIDRPMNDPENKAAIGAAADMYRELYKAINQLDSL